jgi:hypothetical protein
VAFQESEYRLTKRFQFPRTLASHGLEKRVDIIALAGFFITATAEALFPVQVGVYSWVGSIWNTTTRCLESSFDCLFGVADSVFGVWRSFFTFNRGINKRGDGKPLVYAMTAREDDPRGVHWEFHVPVGNHTRFIQVIRNQFKFDGNYTFQHVATVYRNDIETHHVLHRFAHPDDLGKENDGNYHHLRAQVSGAQTNSSNQKRAESDMDHVVGDYLWRDGNSAIFNDIKNENTIGNDIGSNLANWMEENNSEATCASIRTFVPVSEGGPVPEYEDQGVFAYGWNDSPFNFAGRAGSWVDQCI